MAIRVIEESGEVQAARTVDLAGPWRVRADPRNEGLERAWWRSTDWGGDAGTMQIPGAFQKALGPDYHGVAWLARTVQLPAAWRGPGDNGQRLRLRFESVATDATVWVNAVEVGRHVGDFVPFQFDITDAATGRADLTSSSVWTRCTRIALPPAS